MMWRLAAWRAATGAVKIARVKTVRAGPVLLVLSLLMLASAPAARAASLNGGYDGIGAAAGMSMTLSQAERRVVGRLLLKGGIAYALNGERADVSSGSAQGALRAVGATRDSAFFHVEERPLGLQLLFIPARADGTPDIGASREYSFLKRGVRPILGPDAAPSYQPAPADPVDILAFIDGFRGWAPRDTARLYAQLDERSRGLILLYDHATAEILWRLCEAPAGKTPLETRRLGEMLERQQTDCADYLPRVAAARKGRLFSEFLRRSQFQLELIRATVLCDRGETSQARCADVSALGSPLILRWQRAQAIMATLAPAVSADEPAVAQEEAAPKLPLRDEEADAGVVAELRGEGEMESGSALGAGPLPLPRPERPVEGATVSDFAPDVVPVWAEADPRFRLPLARPD
ncbi:MAG: hypothetical protein K9G30_05005 [Parvibaculum sp.]|nr:hypothetical protein [Parvibaculum sp.]